jgi:alkanesulfonate monooxygenase SsuD/methylene tetrahydromethanopterin reductase-like flavin-dependent oxidoreductase (luciferase family)
VRDDGRGRSPRALGAAPERRLADGAITWLCPIAYVAQVGKPALRRGAERAGRAAPPVVAHVLVSPRLDRGAVLGAARAMLRTYAEAVFYQRMFAAAGFPLGPDLELPDALLDTLVVSGDPSQIEAGLAARLEQGADELLLSLVTSDDATSDQRALFEMISRF